MGHRCHEYNSEEHILEGSWFQPSIRINEYQPLKSFELLK